MENRNTAWAAAFVDELVRGGLRIACVASGSRSSPLVIALADRTAGDGLLLVPQVDERAAAFFALGAAKATGRAAAVVTTSGTAVANLMPAVVEAVQSETPLLVLTADRPAHLRGTDANQTVDQLRIFGPYARLFLDVGVPRAREDLFRYVRALAARAFAAMAGPPAGPVHLNFQFEKPLEPTRGSGDLPEAWRAEPPPGVAGRAEGSPFTGVDDGRLVPARDTVDELARRLGSVERGLIVCGPTPRPWTLGPSARALAAVTGWPLLADPLSGARFGPGSADVAVDGYDLALGSSEVSAALAPDVVLRFGSAPTSAALLGYLKAHAGSEQVVVDAGARWKDASALASRYVRAEAAATCDALSERLRRARDGRRPPSAWRQAWHRAGAAARSAVEPLLRERPFEGTVAAELARQAPAGGTLFIGSSMPVRDLDSFAAPRDAPLLVIGNRGASGIDGGVSVAAGAAAARRPAPTVALLGDLAFYHDMNGLLAARRLAIDLTLVVVHNDGGGIFHFLPIRDEEAFERFVAMPHGLDFSHAAAAYGLPFRRLEGAGELATADELSSAASVRILEVPSNREENRRRRQEALEAARRAAAAALDRSTAHAPAFPPAAAPAGRRDESNRQEVREKK